eukprot:scaffold480828_cov45-Prasinocladus_malaysianus.AAC.1
MRQPLIHLKQPYGTNRSFKSVARSAGLKCKTASLLVRPLRPNGIAPKPYRVGKLERTPTTAARY